MDDFRTGILSLETLMSTPLPSDHFDPITGRYQNPTGPTGTTFRNFLKWKLTPHRTVAWPRFRPNQAYPPLPDVLAPQQVGVTMIGHATQLVRLGGKTLLTDPVFSRASGPFGWLGPQRVQMPGIALADLPAIDVVLVSHNHYDHMDLPALKWLSAHRQPWVITGLGTADFLRRNGVDKVIELDWWQSHTVDTLTVHFTPAQHWSARGIFDQNKMLWGAFWVRAADGPSVYFAGDTSYAGHFAETRRRLGAPTVALLPIGAYEPRWFMKNNHMNPDDAVRAHLDLGAMYSLAIHHAIFRLTDEGIDEPAAHLAQARLAHQIQPEQFGLIDVAESRVFG